MRPNAVDDIIKKKMNLSDGNNLSEQVTDVDEFVKSEPLPIKTTSKFSNLVNILKQKKFNFGHYDFVDLVLLVP